MSDMIHLGEDLGMGANKMWGSQGGLETLSQVATASGAKLDAMLGLKAKARPVEVRMDAGRFYVGAGAHDYGRPVESLDFDRLIGAPEMRALVYGSLALYQRQYGRFEGPVSLMVGLPLQMMQGEQAPEYQRAVKGWLRGHHAWEADGETMEASISDVKLAPQALGALFDHVLDEQGRLIAERRSLLMQEVGILSVGFNTLELLVIRDRSAVERFSAGNTVGVRRLLELVNTSNYYSLGELDMMLRAGKLHDIQEAVAIWSREVNGEIEKRWGSAFRRFAKVLVVGGGALLLREAITTQFRGRASVPEDAVMSVSRGLWKLSIMKRS